MSATETPSAADAAAGQSPDPSDVAGGIQTPDEQGAEATETEEGAEPSSEQPEGEESPEARSHPEAEPDPRDEQIQAYESLVAQINASPYADKLLAYLNGQPADGGAETDPVEAFVKETWPESYRDPTTNEVVDNTRTHRKMLEFAKLIQDTTLRAVNGRYDREIQAVRTRLSGSTYHDRLADLGIDATTRKGDAWRKFEREYERDEEVGPVLRKLREQRPAAAARMVYDAFVARNGTRARNVQERNRIDKMRKANLNGASPRGGPTSQTEFKSFSDYIKARQNGYPGTGGAPRR